MDWKVTVAPRGWPAAMPYWPFWVQAASAIAQMAANSTPGRDIRRVARQARPPKLHCIDTPVAGLVFVFWISRPGWRVAAQPPLSPDERPITAGQSGEEVRDNGMKC